MKHKYLKSCVICGRVYGSDARGQRYCSPECAAKGQEKIKEVNKKRQTRRIYQRHNHEEVKLMVQAYQLARAVAEKFYPTVCAVCGEIDMLEVHHKDRNPLNNQPGNLEWLCKKHHSEAHAGLKRISFVEALKRAVESEDRVATFEEAMRGDVENELVG